jgi:hypothetical protein
MALADDLTAWVKETFKQPWEEEKTVGVPKPEDLRLNANHAKNLEEAVVLYADLDGSTDMVVRRRNCRDALGAGRGRLRRHGGLICGARLQAFPVGRHGRRESFVQPQVLGEQERITNVSPPSRSAMRC